MNRFKFIKDRGNISQTEQNQWRALLGLFVPNHLYPDIFILKNEFDSEGYNLDVPFGKPL